MPPGWTAALTWWSRATKTPKTPASTKLTTIARGENERSEVVNTYGVAGFVEVESMYTSTIDWDILQWTADVIANIGPA